MCSGRTMGAPESGQERVWFAREVTGLFVKAFTNLKLYPREHTYCVEALEAFTKRLKAYVRMHGALRIAVESGRLAVEEQTVYEAESRQENLAFRLYVDGLRELSILPGVDSSEAERLALVFTRVLTNPELDSTQQLWEEDFRAIEYVAIDSLAEAWETPDSFSAEHLRSVEEANRDVSRLAESLTERGLIGALTFELTDGAAELRRVEVEEANRAEVEAAQDEALAEFLAGAVTEDEEEPEPQGMREFREDVLSWGPDRLLEGVVSQSLWGLFEAAGELTPESVRWVTREALDMALKAHDLELVRRLVTRYVDAYQRSEEEQSRREAAGRLGEGVDVVEVRRAVDEAVSERARGRVQQREHL